MKPLHSRTWRGILGRNLRTARRIHSLADEIYNANKPADLTYPKAELLHMIQIIRDEQMEWLEKTLKMNPQNRGKYPHL